MAEIDAFLKIDTIPGSATDGSHGGEMRLETFQFGARQAGTQDEGPGGTAGRSSPTRFFFTKKVDKATPLLYKACAAGEHIPHAVVNIRKAGGTQKDYLTYTLSNIVISAVQCQVGDKEPLPRDYVELNYGKLVIEYKEQQSDGSVSGSVTGGYDFKNHQPV
jgi:type VI secretion system secreted protein Hcp